MITVSALSGGKTSSYMAVHYPADYEIFSLVCVDDKTCAPKDKKIIQLVNDKLNKNGFIDKYGDFIGTAEDDRTLKVMFDLEQLIGRDVTWIRGVSFDALNKRRNSVPNMFRRYCTKEMKLLPIATFTYFNIMPQYEMQPVWNNVGFRYDEMERCRNGIARELREKVIVGQLKGGRNKWKEVFWAVANYPLVYDKVMYHKVRDFWKDQKIAFPEDSNCVGCFWKPDQQLRKNFDDNPEKMNWFANQETKKAHFRSGTTYKNIEKHGLQMDFNFGTGSGCQAGYCTD